MYPPVYDEFIKHVNSFGRMTIFVPTPVFQYGLEVGQSSSITAPFSRIDPDLREGLELAVAEGEDPEITITFELIRISHIEADKKRTVVFLFNNKVKFSVKVDAAEASKSTIGIKADLKDKSQVAAPVPALVTEVLCKVGDKVVAGQELIKLTSMKMVVNIPAPHDGNVTAVSVKVGDKVNNGILLLKVAPLKKD